MRHQLVQDDCGRVKVGASAVRLMADHLGRHPSICARLGGQHLALAHRAIWQLNGHSKVSELRCDAAVRIASHEHVCRLDVAMHHASAVQVLEGGGDPAGDAEDEAGRRRPVKRVVQVAAHTELEHEAEIGR